MLPDDLPWVTGSIGLLGTRPSYELMRDCDTLLIVGSLDRDVLDRIRGVFQNDMVGTSWSPATRYWLLSFSGTSNASKVLAPSSLSAVNLW